MAFLLLLSGASAAAVIPVEALKKHGINPEFFHIDRFSADRSVLFGIEKRTNPAEIHARGAYVLWMLHLDGNRRLVRLSSINLPIRKFQQITYSDDTTQALLVSEYGANYYMIDIPARKVKKIASHVKGTPGFRQADPILYYVNGSFYGFGYFYDKDDVTSTDVYLVRVHPELKGQDMFEKCISMRDVRAALGISTFGAYLPPDRVIWGVRRPQDKLLELKLYNNGSKQLLDAGIGFTGVVHTDTRIFYVVKKPGKKARWDAVVRDLDTNKIWHLGDGRTALAYPFICQTGSTVAATAFDFKRKKTRTYFARRDRDFKLQPIQTLQNVPFGTFRLSPDGAWYAYYNPQAIYVDEVK